MPAVGLDPVGVGVDHVRAEVVDVLLDVGELAGAEVVNDARADGVAENVDGRAEPGINRALVFTFSLNSTETSGCIRWRKIPLRIKSSKSENQMVADFDACTRFLDWQNVWFDQVAGGKKSIPYRQKYSCARCFYEAIKSDGALMPCAIHHWKRLIL